MTRFRWGVVLGTALIMMVSLVVSLLSAVGDTVPAMVADGGLPVIIIDPGHGGADGGAVGVDEIIEKDINLSLALTLRDMFEVNGFTVVMTRDIDVSIHDAGVEGLRSQKTSDLHNRLAIIESYPGAIFISVHMNKFGDSSQSGTQVFYGPNNPASEELATILQANIVRTLQPNNRRQTKRGEKNLYLIFEASCPAVLIEYGFVSNAAEARRLADPEYQSQLAFATFCSVVEYLGMASPDAGPLDAGAAQ